MGELTFACAVSHAPGLTGWPGAADPASLETATAMYRAVADSLAAADPDVLVIVGNDHVNNARLSDYPDFIVGAAAHHEGPAEWFEPWLNVAPYRLQGRPDLAQELARRWPARAGTVVDIRRSDENLRFDDNVSVPATLLSLQERGIAVIPVLQNCIVPPVPDGRSCYRLGQALRDVIDHDIESGTSVGVLASGGLSHEPGGPGYLEIDEAFDREFLERVSGDDHQALLAWATFDAMEAAGSGGTAELLSWLIAAGMVGPRPGRCLGYVAERQWRCGVGGIEWEL